MFAGQLNGRSSWQFSLLSLSLLLQASGKQRGFLCHLPSLCLSCTAFIFHISASIFSSKRIAAREQCNFLRLGFKHGSIPSHWHIPSLAAHWQIPLRQTLDSSRSSFQRVLFHFAVRLQSQLSPVFPATVFKIPRLLPGEYSRLSAGCHLPALIFLDSIFSTVTRLTVYKNIHSNGRDGHFKHKVLTIAQHLPSSSD